MSNNFVIQHTVSSFVCPGFSSVAENADDDTCAIWWWELADVLLLHFLLYNWCFHFLFLVAWCYFHYSSWSLHTFMSGFPDCWFHSFLKFLRMLTKGAISVIVDNYLCLVAIRLHVSCCSIYICSDSCQKCISIITIFFAIWFIQ